MILRNGPDIRVERDEWRMRTETGAGVAVTLMLAGYFASRPDRSIGPLVAAGLVGLALVLFVVGVRYRPLLVIEPTRIGYGRARGELSWIERDRIGSVIVRRDLAVQVRFYDSDDQLIGSHVLSYVDADELRRAFGSAGITVR